MSGRTPDKSRTAVRFFFAENDKSRAGSSPSDITLKVLLQSFGLGCKAKGLAALDR